MSLAPALAVTYSPTSSLTCAHTFRFYLSLFGFRGS